MEWRYELKDILATAHSFWNNTKGEKVFAIHGGMGAGKTTFIHALCEARKVSSVAGSPTFSIINQYEYPGGIIHHIDLYRLKDEDEAIRAGVEDSLYSGDYCLVEWPERAPGLFPGDTVHVNISAIDEQTRLVRIGDK